MSDRQANIIIFGAGIAGLWTLKRLTELGYDARLLEKDAIGAGQTIASQGIIHSGLKYALGGKISRAAQEIAAMPEIWRETFPDECRAAPRQMLLIPDGFAGKIVGAAAEKIFGAHKITPSAEITASGFCGQVLELSEPVLDIPEILRKLTGPLRDKIKKIDTPPLTPPLAGGKSAQRTGGEEFRIFTAAEGNAQNGGPDIQRRPLLMGMMKNAPFPLFAHFAGLSDKPVMTVTTHKTKDGALVWYIGGAVAERAKNSPPENLFRDIKAAFAKYMPALDLSGAQWAALPIDRIEGKADGLRMPDAPVIIEKGNALYCWPTKLTFAPLLADMIVEKVKAASNNPPRHSEGAEGDRRISPFAKPNEILRYAQNDENESLGFADPPWDKAQWKK